MRPGQDAIPRFVRVLHERDEIDVLHQHKARHGDHLREGAGPPDAPGEQGDEQVGDQHHPGLYLDGVDAVPVEEMEREILLELLVERLYGPPEAVYLGDIPHREIEAVGQQHDRAPAPIEDLHPAGLVGQLAPGEPHALVHMRGQALRVDVGHRIEHPVREVPLHLGGVAHALLGEPLELRDVDVGPIHREGGILREVHLLEQVAVVLGG